MTARPLGVVKLIQSYYPRIGGAETQVAALTPRLATLGANVVVVTRRYPGMGPSGLVDGQPVVRLPKPGGRLVASLVWTLATLLFLARQRRRIDLIHAHELLSPTTAAVLAKLLLRWPVVVTAERGGLLGDLAVLRTGRFGRARLALFRRLVDRFVAISAEIENELLDAGIPAERVCRIPHAVDAARFRPAEPAARDALRRERDLDGHRVALFLARVEPEKGLDTLLDAWPGVLARLPDALLVVVGEGSLRVSLEARGVSGVRFVGATHQPLPWFQSADCYVLPSYSEGLPVALLEALASGLPAVVSNIGGSAEVVRDGVEGFLTPPGEATALSTAVASALANGQREKLGQAARQRVLADFALDQTAARLAALYHEMARPERG